MQDTLRGHGISDLVLVSCISQNAGWIFTM